MSHSCAHYFQTPSTQATIPAIFRWVNLLRIIYCSTQRNLIHLLLLHFDENSRCRLDSNDWEESFKKNRFLHLFIPNLNILISYILSKEIKKSLRIRVVFRLLVVFKPLYKTLASFSPVYRRENTRLYFLF